MILYGSKPSPYVRRVRMLLHGSDYQFEAVNIFDQQERAQFARLSPVRKLPILQDEEQLVFDSHVIAQHLFMRLKLPPLTLPQQNLISVTDAVIDAWIIQMMAQRSGLDPDSDLLLLQLQGERIPDALGWLESKVEHGSFAQWQYPSMCLLAAIEWAQFRQLFQFDAYPGLLSFEEQWRDEPAARATRPE